MASLRESTDADGDCAMSSSADCPKQQLSSDPFPLLCLPPEIVNHVLTLACRAPKSDMSAEKVAKRSLLALDVKTTLNLAQVSRAFSEMIVTILYYAVRITKPSALLELLRTLKARPDLGKLVKHLHIGAEKTLVPRDWPLVVELEEDGIHLEHPVLWLRTSLSSKEEGERYLPKWCKPGRSWSLEPGRVDCRGAAVGAAIRAAMKKIDIEPYRRGYAKSGERIGLEQWTIRLFLLQAALDLWLVQLRRHEDAKGYAVSPWQSAPEPGPPQCPAICRLGNCKHYPRLIVTDSIDPTKLDFDRKKRAIKMPMGLLWLKLSERGGHLDQFDHPILFARSGLKTSQLNEYGQDLIRARLTGPAGPHFAPSVYDPEASEDEDFESDDSNGSSPTGKAAKGFAPPDMAPNHTMPGIINRACDVLFLTPNVVNLSINGFLQLCLCIRIPVFETMRSFALGPLLPFFAAAVCFNDEKGPTMAKLENLLISGDILMKDEAERIAGKEGRLPSLKRFQWEMVQTTKPYEDLELGLERVYDLICRLQGQHGAACEGSPRLIEVRLHPQNCPTIWQLATPEQRAAWLVGKPLSSNGQGPHRVQLVESVAANTKLTPAREGNEKLHENAREWWEDCAALEKDRESGKIVREEGWMPNMSGRRRLVWKDSSERQEWELSRRPPRLCERVAGGAGRQLGGLLTPTCPL